MEPPLPAAIIARPAALMPRKKPGLIHRNRAIPGCKVGIDKAVHRSIAGVIDENVKASMAVHDVIDHGSPSGLIGDIQMGISGLPSLHLRRREHQPELPLHHEMRIISPQPPLARPPPVIRVTLPVKSLISAISGFPCLVCCSVCSNLGS